MLGIPDINAMHWLILFVNVCIMLLPCWRIVQRAGLPGAWSLLLFVPLVNIVALWIFAFFVVWPTHNTTPPA
jgi:hypothetical protein